MENFDQISLISLGVAGSLIAYDFMGYSMPTMVTDLLDNQTNQMVLGVLVVLASYYHLPTAIVLAALLYVALNIEKSEEPTEPSRCGKVLKKTKHMENVKGMLSDPDLEPIENPLPTQDNRAPVVPKVEEKSKETSEEPVDPTMTNQENLDELVGFGGVDLAPTL